MESRALTKPEAVSFVGRHPWLRTLIALSLIGFGVFLFFRNDPGARAWLVAAGCICIAGGVLAWAGLRRDGILLFHMGLGVSWIGCGLVHHTTPLLVLGAVAVSVFPVVTAVRMVSRRAEAGGERKAESGEQRADET